MEKWLWPDRCMPISGITFLKSARPWEFIGPRCIAISTSARMREPQADDADKLVPIGIVGSSLCRILDRNALIHIELENPVRVDMGIKEWGQSPPIIDVHRIKPAG